MKRKETSPALRSRGCQCGFLSTGLRTVDILGYYPPDLQRSYNESKHELGGIMSILIPAVLGVVYYLMYLTNEQQPPVRACAPGAHAGSALMLWRHPWLLLPDDGSV